jgi:hypothetical protein
MLTRQVVAHHLANGIQPLTDWLADAAHPAVRIYEKRGDC